MKNLMSGKISVLALTTSFAIVSLILGNIFIFAPNIFASASKVYVCKYVGTPGVNETLQTGQNPIDVSVNSIKNFQGIGSYFNDAQGRSYVLAYAPESPEPTASDCPQNPPAPSLWCNGIVESPSFASGSKFSLGTIYTFTPTISSGTPTNYLWSISDLPALSSTTGSTTSWTAPSVAHPGYTWTLNLEISDNSGDTAYCSSTFSDPTVIVYGCTDPEANNYNADATFDDESCIYDESTPTPTATVTPTVEPTATPLECSGDTHLDASGKNCVSYQYGGAPQGGNGGSTGGQVLGASTTAGGQILGASTMAKTGSFEETIYEAIMGLGGLLTFKGAKNLKKKAKTAKKAKKGSC